MKKVFSKIFWIIIILLMCLWTYEFYRIRNGKYAQFCIRNAIYEYTDGITKECVGLGYKVYEYRRNELKGTEFVSIFAKQRQPEIKEKNDIENIEETGNIEE